MKYLIAFMIFSLSFADLLAQKRVVQLKTKEELLNEQYCSGLFNTPHGQYFDMEDPFGSSALAYTNILDWLQGRVAGLQVLTTRDRVRIPIIRNMRAGIFVNEMRVDYDFLNMLPVTDIAMVKIIKEPFLGSWGGPGGAIAIYTWQGEEGEEGEDE